MMRFTKIWKLERRVTNLSEIGYGRWPNTFSGLTLSSYNCESEIKCIMTFPGREIRMGHPLISEEQCALIRGLVKPTCVARIARDGAFYNAPISAKISEEVDHILLTPNNSEEVVDYQMAIAVGDIKFPHAARCG